MIRLPREHRLGGAPVEWIARSVESCAVDEVTRKLVPVGTDVEADSIGQLPYNFNREFNEPTPSPSALAARIKLLLEGGDTLILSAGEGPEGLAVLRFRRAIWSSDFECYLAELCVVPHQRHQGIGRALTVAAMDEARERGPTR